MEDVQLKEKSWWDLAMERAIARNVELLRKDIDAECLAECLRGTKDVKPA